MSRLPSPARAFCCLLLLPAVIVAAEKGGEPEKTVEADKGRGLPKFSPFEQRGAASAPVAANETLEFAGVSSMGQRTDLIFYDKTAKKSHWIAKGETKEGIAVVSYDERREEAVVKVNGVQKTLPLRKTAGPVNSPRPAGSVPGGFNVATATPLPAPVPAQIPVPAPTAPTATNTNQATTQLATPPPAPGSAAEVQARQETEARMLVSDLLEIGMAQRRAYEEAQRKAADGTAQTTPATATTTPGVQPPVAPSPAPNAAVQPPR